MNWFIAVPLGWAVVAVVLGLLVGNGIRMECGIEPEARVGTARVVTEKVGTARVGTDEVGTDAVSVPAAASVAPASAGAVGSAAGAERAAVQVRQAVLTGAR